MNVSLRKNIKKGRRSVDESLASELLNRLTEDRSRYGLTIDEMASALGVNSNTFQDFLYRREKRGRKSGISVKTYTRIMEKLETNALELACAKKKTPKDISDAGSEDMHIAVSECIQQVRQHIFSKIDPAYQGSSEECWLHYMEIYKADTSEQDILKTYFSINRVTFKRWTTDLILPSGKYLIKLRSFLARRGYSVSEWNRLPTCYRQLGHFLADGVIGFDSAAALLGYPSDQGILGLYLRATRFFNDRSRQCQELVLAIEDFLAHKTSGRDEISEEKADMPVASPLLADLASTVSNRDKVVDGVHVPEPTVSNGTHVVSSPRRSRQRDTTVEDLAAVVRLIFPLAERLLSDQYSDDDRYRLLELTGSNIVPLVATYFDGLSSREMRRRVLETMGSCVGHFDGGIYDPSPVAQDQGTISGSEVMHQDNYRPAQENPDAYPYLQDAIYQSVENALDAHASRITVSIETQKRLVIISDNGDGISFERMRGLLSSDKEKKSLLAFMRKCERYSIISTPREDCASYHEWQFEGTSATQDAVIVVPCGKRTDLYYSSIGGVWSSLQTSRGVPWRTGVVVEGFFDTGWRQPMSAESLKEALRTRFGHRGAMIEVTYGTDVESASEIIGVHA